MIVRSKEGWHVHSESGKNLGGPYRSRAEAVKRLQQVEYFKHHKTAGLGLNMDRQSKLLVGRANAGDNLTEKEKQLLKKVGPLPTKNTFDKERFWASPLGRVTKGGITAGTIAGSVYVTRKANELAPKILSADGYKFYQKALERFTPKTVKQLAELPITKAERIAGGLGLLGPVAFDLIKPTVDRARYPGVMQAQAIKDKKTDSGIDAQLRTQLKKNASTTELVLDNIDLLNQLPIGNPKKKEELLEALKKVENGSKAQAVMDKISSLASKLETGVLSRKPQLAQKTVRQLENIKNLAHRKLQDLNFELAVSIPSSKQGVAQAKNVRDSLPRYRDTINRVNHYLKEVKNNPNNISPSSDYW